MSEWMWFYLLQWWTNSGEIIDWFISEDKNYYDHHDNETSYLCIHNGTSSIMYVDNIDITLSIKIYSQRILYDLVFYA